MRIHSVRRLACATIFVMGVVGPQRIKAQVVGIYADSLASSCNLTIPFPGSPVDVYVLFISGPRADSTGGVSFSINGLPQGWTGEAFANPNAELMFGDPFVGASMSFSWCQPGGVVLYRLRLTPSSAVVNHELWVGRGPAPHEFSCPQTFSCGNQAGTSLPFARALINGTTACTADAGGSCPWTDAVDFSPAETSLVVAPNPGTQNAAIHYMVAREFQSARLTLYDLRGREVARIFEGSLPSRKGSIAWDGRDTAGKTVGAGIYILRLEADGGGSVSRKLAWIR